MYKIQEAEMLANNIYRMVVEHSTASLDSLLLSRQMKKEKEFL